MLAKGCCHALMRQAFLLAALLVLGSVAAAAAAPGPRPEAAADAGPRFGQAQATTSAIVPTNAEPILPEKCPGIEANGTICGKVRGGVEVVQFSTAAQPGLACTCR